MEYKFTFRLAADADIELIRGWLDKPHVQEFFYGEGLQNTLDDLDKWERKANSLWEHWIALCNATPFGYLITSAFEESEDDYARWMVRGKKAITLDLLIGEEDFLGQGLSVRMIQEFLLTQFPDVAFVFIDPAANNPKAIHVYEKAGFQKLGSFVPDYDPIPHWMMRLDMSEVNFSP